jgi:hypothetical protein
MRAAGVLVASLAVGACMDAPPSSPPQTSCGDPTYYRIDQVELPYRAGSVTPLGLDLDGDGQVDNALGSGLSTIHSGNPELGSLDAKANARLTADVTWLVAVSACADGTQHVELGQSGGGDAVPISVLVDPIGDYAPVAWARIDLRAEHLAITDASVGGVVGFILPMPDAAHAMAGPFAAYLTTELTAGTSPLAAELDADHDGVVSADELVASDFGKTILAPDLPAGFSGGLKLHATRVALGQVAP